PWWISLRSNPPPPITPATWNRRCSHCNARLLSTESNSFCCKNGQRVLPNLYPLPQRMKSLLNHTSHGNHLRHHYRSINNLFTFAGIGVSGGFEHFSTAAGTGPPSVAITGRTYHLLRNTEYTDHSIHWFFYDEGLRTERADQFGIHATIVDEIKCDLQDINPYVNSLQHFRSSPSSSLHVVELKDFSSNHDFTAVMHAANTTIINPRSILIRRHGDPHPQAINILSHHYEPLHYVLLFPHGEIGWGASDVPHIPHLSQIDWYRSRLLADNDDPFTNFGRLCCEYLVDMYSRTEEQ
ncbi:hypothetical protein V8E55_008658, partial [Tylopilus felleus]